MNTIELTEQDTKAAIDLAERIIALLNEQPRITCEVALLITYTMVAGGCEKYPPETKRQRRQLVVERGSTALATIVDQVGALPDAVLPN